MDDKSLVATDEATALRRSVAFLRDAGAPVDIRAARRRFLSRRAAGQTIGASLVGAIVASRVSAAAADDGETQPVPAYAVADSMEDLFALTTVCDPSETAYAAAKGELHIHGAPASPWLASLAAEHAGHGLMAARGHVGHGRDLWGSPGHDAHTGYGGGHGAHGGSHAGGHAGAHSGAHAGVSGHSAGHLGRHESGHDLDHASLGHCEPRNAGGHHGDHEPGIAFVHGDHGDAHAGHNAMTAAGAHDEHAASEHEAPPPGDEAMDASTHKHAALHEKDEEATATADAAAKHGAHSHRHDEAEMEDAAGDEIEPLSEEALDVLAALELESGDALHDTHADHLHEAMLAVYAGASPADPIPAPEGVI